MEFDRGAATHPVPVGADVSDAVLDDDCALGAGCLLGVQVAVGGVHCEVVGDLLLGQLVAGSGGARSSRRRSVEEAHRVYLVDEARHGVGVDGDRVRYRDLHFVDQPIRVLD